jgi:hypothetical protein
MSPTVRADDSDEFCNAPSSAGRWLQGPKIELQNVVHSLKVQGSGE